MLLRLLTSLILGKDCLGILKEEIALDENEMDNILLLFFIVGILIFGTYGSFMYIIFVGK